MKKEFEEYIKLIREFDALPEIIISDSIFDIAGYPHYENVCSNILAFYLNPNNEHGLGNLLLSSLLNLSSGNEVQPKNINVHREIFTSKGGRLDIVIETDSQLIGIENKIFHILNNDLADYSNTLVNWAKPNNLDTIKIILSLKKETESHGFISITYEQYFGKVKERLGEYISTSSQKWVLYLIDFMSSIEKLYGGQMEMDINKNDQFFIDNEKKIESLINARNKFISKLNKIVRQLSEITEQPGECKKWIYAKTCLVHDFNFSGNLIAFDMNLYTKGWELTLFGRNLSSISYLDVLMSQNPLSDYKDKFEKKGERFIIERMDLKTDLNELKERLIFWMGTLIQTENSNQVPKVL